VIGLTRESYERNSWFGTLTGKTRRSLPRHGTGLPRARLSEHVELRPAHIRTARESAGWHAAPGAPVRRMLGAVQTVARPGSPVLDSRLQWFVDVDPPPAIGGRTPRIPHPPARLLRRLPAADGGARGPAGAVPHAPLHQYLDLDAPGTIASSGRGPAATLVRPVLPPPANPGGSRGALFRSGLHGHMGME